MLLSGRALRGRIVIALCIAASLFLTGCERRFYLLTRRYEPSELSAAAHKTEVIEYRTRGGWQKAFYIKPAIAPNAPPDRVWMMFGGNGSLALNWIGRIADSPDPRAGFYLFDYPGSGCNEGRSTRSSVAEASVAAVDALAARFRMTTPELCARLRIFCHSLGTAAGLNMAVELESPPRQIILLAPLTSLRELASWTAGWPAGWFVPDRFDNDARLKELAARKPRPRVTIVHGARDTVIPVKMGRALAAGHKGWIDYHEFNTDHVGVINAAKPIWFEMMEQWSDQSDFESF